MNKRIKELAEQAGGEFYEGFAGGTNFVKFAEDDFEKFAELIVRECIEKGNVLMKHYINNHSEQKQVFLLTAIADYSNEIEKHFGVEK